MVTLTNAKGSVTMKERKHQTRPLSAYLPSASVARQALADAKRRVEELNILADAAERAEKLQSVQHQHESEVCHA